MNMAYKSLSLSFATLLGCFGCDTPQESNNSGLDSSLWGRWIYIDSGNNIQLTKDSHYSPSMIDSNLIAITSSNGTTRYLLRDGSSSVPVSGYVNSLANSASKALFSSGQENAGGISLILTNKDDDNLSSTTTTASDDSINTTVPAGDYQISSNYGGVGGMANITVSGESTDFGTLNLVGDTANFKAEIVSNNHFFYADNSLHSGHVTITNTGSYNASGLSYNFICNSPYITSCDIPSSVSSLHAGGSRSFPYTLSFSPITEERVQVRIPVVITDTSNQSWTDEIVIPLYRESVHLNYAAQGYFRAVVLAPGHQVVYINAPTGSLEIPYRSNGSVAIVISASIASYEKFYSFGLNTPVTLDSSFTNTASFEPNNHAAEASSVSIGQIVTSYIHAGDVDYYTFDMPITQ